MNAGNPEAEDPGRTSEASASNKKASKKTITPREHPFNALADRFPTDNLNVLAHFYRGELGRSIAWRQKMDMTTHWAIITATALVSVAFSTPLMPHIILPFASVLIFLLLHIEGRRYRFFDVWRTRVRMLEVHFIVPSLAFEHRLPEGNWREQLCNDLFRPTYKISYWEAIGRRLHRNYIWLFVLTLVAWIGKIFLSCEPGEFLKAFAITRIGTSEVLVPAWAVIMVVAAFHLFILGLFIYAIVTREASGEIRRKDPAQRTWPI